MFGVRETKDLYKFEYQGKLAIIQRENVRFGRDLVFLLLNDKDRVYSGNVVSDDGKVIEFGKTGKYNNNVFSVKENNQ